MILDVSQVCSKLNSDLVTFIHNIVVLIKIAVPIVLVLFGMLDLGKGVIAAKEDEIKKGQSTFIKRLLAGVLVFFMITIVQLVISLIDKDSNGDFWTCANGILNGKVNWDPKTERIYDEEQIRTQNPATFQYCCESLNGMVKGSYCWGANDERIPSDEIISCANNIQNNVRTKYNDKARSCCTQFGGSFSNNQCKDKNGGSIPDEKINGCIIIDIKQTDTDTYKNCCESKGGHFYNGNCVDSNGGSISDISVNSCILSNYK